ncbi:butyrophilin subfamily 1 member A1-like isoform X2 [Hemicordylus capensis]|uniref:butyrophilin subfamily 1 member A1-like isoform X2 n=1 Tax=Hemicordylus capensis TaxID=884348 RepID=UPI002302339D|nr:butyrophilin subfamily 1 member A1-like isoform X2 [Hemicordylus capensis]
MDLKEHAIQHHNQSSSQGWPATFLGWPTTILGYILPDICSGIRGRMKTVSDISPWKFMMSKMETIQNRPGEIFPFIFKGNIFPDIFSGIHGHMKIVSNISPRNFLMSTRETIQNHLGQIFPFVPKEHQKQIEELQKQIEKLQNQLEFSDARFYRADIVLNPKTAHPRLEVSEDGKCVRDTGIVSKVSNSKERFDSYTCILATEGFSNGKHYWEVEVGPKKRWGLGVASESASRKGDVTLYPQNGYWVIEFDERNECWARTDPWTHLNLSGKPSRIGIFLNMSDSSSSLTFYDVQKESKLYTFAIKKHDGKMYPFFSTGSVTAELDSQTLKIPPLF